MWSTSSLTVAPQVEPSWVGSGLDVSLAGLGLLEEGEEVAGGREVDPAQRGGHRFDQGARRLDLNPFGVGRTRFNR